MHKARHRGLLNTLPRTIVMYRNGRYCYCVGIQSNTNIYVESFRNVLITAYMQRKANHRIDSIVGILLKINSM